MFHHKDLPRIFRLDDTDDICKTLAAIGLLILSVIPATVALTLYALALILSTMTWACLWSADRCLDAVHRLDRIIHPQ